METDTVSIEQFVKENRVVIRAERVDRNPNMRDQQMDHWKVTLKTKRDRCRSLTLYFSKGYGHNGASPEVAEVLNCLASESSGTDQDFADWCSDLGYDADSREAERIYKVCLHQAGRLRRFLGDEQYERLLYHVDNN